MRLFSQSAVDSTTVKCDLMGECEDVILISEGPNGHYSSKVARFGYRHSAVESSLYTTASALSLDGEMFLRQGKSYWLTATHFCYADAPYTQSSFGMISASVNSDGKIVTSSSSLLSSDDTRTVPAANNDYITLCPNFTDQVLVFPVGASSERSWLSISDSEVYNREPDTVEERRAISEIGTQCADNVPALSRALTLYKLDCLPYSSCSTDPNIPFRRLARTSIHINIDSSNSVGVWTVRENTLEWLPKLSDSMVAFLLSLVKLLLITLAAAVVYVRSKRHTASSSWLFKHCLNTATTCGQTHDKDDSFSVFEDGVIGFLAFTARASITVYRLNYALLDDNQARVCVTELIASALSAIHWTIRYYGLERGNYELPISKLGGSTAIIDSSAAVMMAFAESPTLVVSTGRFDPTARLLVALLVATIVVTRCSFSATCCGVLWESETCPERQTYAGMLMFSGVSWVAQSAALAVLIVDLFVTPSSYSMSRNIPGDILPARMLLFLSLVGVGLPRLMKTIRHILSDRKDHVD